MGYAGLDAALGGNRAKLRPKQALIAVTNFRAAMGDNRPGNSLFCAPTKLRPDGRVPYQRVAPLSDERAGERCTVTDVNLHAFQCGGPIMNVEQSGP